MKFSHLVKIDQIQVSNNARSKKKALESISQIASDNYPELDTHIVFEKLIERERLGSTGIGHGIALPHGRLTECTDIIAIFISLTNEIDYDAIDKQPVKYLCSLLLPTHATEEHLEILAQLAEFFRNANNRQRLSTANSIESVYNILSTM